MIAKVKVAILQDYINQFCDRNQTGDPFSCQDAKFQTAFLYLRCMNMSNNYQPVYVDQSYEPDNNMDILPFPFVVHEMYYNRSNFVTTPFLISSYKFFAAKLFDNSTVKPDWSYLVDSFKSPTWITVVLLVVFIKIIKDLATMMSKKYMNKKALAVDSFQILRFSSSVFLALMLGLYASNLKALVNVKIRPVSPFNTVEDLIEMIKMGKKTLVNDSLNVTYVWRVLSGKTLINNEYHDLLKQIYEATINNPAIEIPNIKEVCRRLKMDTNLVFVGRQSDLDEHCPDDCFWTMDIPHIPTVFRSFLFPNESRKYAEEANLCVAFLQNVRERKIQKKKNLSFTNCNRYLRNQLISMTTFLAPTWIWLSGSVLSMIILGMEKFSCFFRKRSIYIQYK